MRVEEIRLEQDDGGFKNRFRYRLSSRELVFSAPPELRPTRLELIKSERERKGKQENNFSLMLPVEPSRAESASVVSIPVSQS